MRPLAPISKRTSPPTWFSTTPSENQRERNFGSVRKAQTRSIGPGRSRTSMTVFCSLIVANVFISHFPHSERARANRDALSRTLGNAKAMHRSRPGLEDRASTYGAGHLPGCEPSPHPVGFEDVGR